MIFEEAGVISGMVTSGNLIEYVVIFGNSGLICGYRGTKVSGTKCEGVVF